MVVSVEWKTYTWGSKTRKRMYTLSKNPRTQPWGKPLYRRRREERKRQIERNYLDEENRNTSSKQKNGMAQRQGRVNFKREHEGLLFTEPFAAHFTE